MAEMSLYALFSQIPDPRKDHGKRHPLPGVLALVTLAILCGRRSYSAIVEWGKDHGPELARQLGLAQHGIPCVSMLHYLFKALDAQAVEQALSQWILGLASSLPAGALEPVSVDGKTLGGSGRHGLPGVHLLSAFAVRLQRVLFQCPADMIPEGGELAAFEKLAATVVLEGKLITGDALFAQRELCATITTERGHYLLAVKDNQPTLLREIQDVFRCPQAPLLSPPTRTPMATASKPAP